MSAVPGDSHAVLLSILDELACPVCLSPLQLSGNSLTCTGCARVYPIVDGIPVLIESIGSDNSGRTAE